MSTSKPDPLRFGRIYKTQFIERPNRFLVRVKSRALGEVEAFMPNPGRMRELLLPGVRIYVTRVEPDNPRKTRYTAIAADRDGAPVFLHTHATNAVARELIASRRVPTLEDAEIVRAEVPVGRSRFDFLLRDDAGEIYLEVKSCTLFGNQVAMFPDAITERGRRHLLELAELAQGTTRSAVLFVVHSPRQRWFMPDYHTDLAFSQTLLEVRDRVRVLPVAITWDANLRLGDSTRLLDIPWEYIEGEAHDRGAYLVLLRMRRKRRIAVGRLGKLAFEPGSYVYVGSAMKNLDARMARHKRLRKKKHWHIDYLRAHADECDVLPIRSSRKEECLLAQAVSELLAAGPEGFGCSDCECPTHLFFSKTDPLNDRAFHSILERFRMAAGWRGLDERPVTSH